MRGILAQYSPTTHRIAARALATCGREKLPVEKEEIVIL
jgi:hypothetical protein